MIKYVGGKMNILYIGNYSDNNVLVIHYMITLEGIISCSVFWTYQSIDSTISGGFYYSKGKIYWTSS